MPNYSKEQDRQNKALEDLMAGREHTKDYVQVGYEGKSEDLGGKTRESRLSKIMQSVRMPLFCPSCKKTMKKKLDRKFWNMANHCMDCHIDMENKLRISGEYETYAKKKINENKKAYLKDLKQTIDEYEETGGKAEYFNSVGVQEVELEKEQWQMGEAEFDKLIQEARDYITNLEKAIDEESKELDTTRISSD